MREYREFDFMLFVAALLLRVLAFWPTREFALRLLACQFWSRPIVAGIGAVDWLGTAISIMW